MIVALRLPFVVRVLGFRMCFDPVGQTQFVENFSRLSTRRTLTMAWLTRKLRIPASEGAMGVVLTVCIITMGLMSVALLWQAQIIANQREAIQWLETLKFGG